MALAGNGRLRHPLREIQPQQRTNLDSFSRAGLSSRLKTGQAPGGSGPFVCAAGPQGKFLTVLSQHLDLANIQYLQLHDDRVLWGLISTDHFESRNLLALFAVLPPSTTPAQDVVSALIALIVLKQ